MKTRDLIERRAKLRDEAQAIIATPEGENGDLTEDQEKRFDELTAEADTLEKRIDRQTRVDEIERRVAGTPADTGSDYASELRGYSLTRAIAGAAGLNVDDGREREMAQEVERREGRAFEGLAVPFEALTIERRTVGTSTPVGGPGSNLIPTVQSTEVIDVLRSAMVTSRLGVRTISGLRGNLDMPKKTKSTAADWFAEGNQITEDDPEFGSVPFRPKHIGALSSMSRNMLLQSSPDIEQIMRSDMADSLAQALDASVLIGGGTDEPVGVASTAGINTMNTATASVIDEDDVIDAISMVLEDDSTVTGVAMSPTVAKALKKLKDTQGRPLNFISGLGASATIDGTYPAAITTALPALADVAIATLQGNWAEVMVGMWGGLDVLVNPYSDAQYTRGAVGVRAIMTADVQVRNAVSFSALSILAA